VAASWVVRELVSAELGDVRLTDRLIRLVSAFAEQPAASIPLACGPAGAKAAYRFLDHEGIDPQQILAPHARRAAQRASEYPVVLAPQDTTTFSFNGQPSKRGLGYVSSDPDSRGLLLHSMLLLNPAGTPLGVVHHQTWSRDADAYGKRETARRRPLEAKESQRWLTSVRALEQALPRHPCVVVIGDQESDIFELFAAPRAAHIHLLVRVRSVNRRVDHAAKYLEKAVAESPRRGQVKIELPRADGRAARTAVLTIKWLTLDVIPPRNHPQRRTFAPVKLQFLLAEEEHPPRGQAPVRWLLATTLPIEGWNDAVRLLVWYTYRWRCERLHYVLKSGCRIEALQLETKERLERALACYLIVAWRLMWLTYEARHDPDRSCAGVLRTHEWQSLCATTAPRKPLPTAPPTLQEAVRLIARLGGFLGRKGDGEPGLKTIWLGLRRLDDISATWQLAHQILARGDPVLHVGNG
jgi:hypothetical protein